MVWFQLIFWTRIQLVLFIYYFIYYVIDYVYQVGALITNDTTTS